ncbi:hypothetical protein [Hydrogenophaga sp. RWCD_12]|uniref:hypothetical protein n=1 Tax=Hydrogenophaga sp. RWCD_12 TaxID=3391190 RepID=UPI003984F6DF
MDSLYFYLLGLVVLAFLINIVLVTRSRFPGGEVGVAPVVQAALAVPLFLVSAAVLFLTRDLGWHTRQWILLLPLVLQLAYFLYTGDLRTFFKPDAGGFLTRSFIGSIAASTVIACALAWAMGALAA